MQDNPNVNKKTLFGIVLLILAIVVAVVVSNLGPKPINPNKDSLLEGGAGKNYAALYKINDIYEDIGENDNVLRSIENDMLTFARTTRAEFASKDSLVGFTFDNKSTEEANTHVYTGYYYGLNDKIQIKLTPHGQGVYTLSITNLRDQTNIDDELSMNGKRNQYIRTLPVEKDRYSIRYQLTEDRIVASFYDGYTSQDVDEVALSIKNGLGEAAEEDVVYSVNRVGIIPIEKVREYIAKPLPLR